MTTQTNTDAFLVFVPNTYRSYGYEIVNVLALPNNFKFRFRFKKDAVHSNITQNVQLNGENCYDHKEGYILLRDHSTGKLYPIRRFVLLELQPLGPIYYFTVELKNLVFMPPEEHSRRSHLAEIRKNVAKDHIKFRGSTNNNKNVTPLVFLSKMRPDADNLTEQSSSQVWDADLWMTIVSTIGKEIDYYKNIQFFAISAIALYNDFSRSRKKIKPGVKNHSWQLKGGRTYEMDVVQFVPRNTVDDPASTTGQSGDTRCQSPQTTRDIGASRDVCIRADDSVVEVVRGVQRPLGKYDVMTFIYRVKSLPYRTDCILDIEYHPLVSQAPGWDLQPRIPFDIKVLPSRHKAVLGTLALPLSISLYSLLSLLEIAGPVLETILQYFSIVVGTVSLFYLSSRWGSGVPSLFYLYSWWTSGVNFIQSLTNNTPDAPNDDGRKP